MTEQTPAQSLLDLRLPDRPAECASVREYLKRLLADFMRGEASYKYGMTGESDWQYDLYAPMINAGLCPGREQWVNDGYGLNPDEEEHLQALLAAAIANLK